MPTYKIINWEKFQHYKDRNPPWIKLHSEILSSKMWLMLADASRVLAIAIMLLAARNGTDGIFDSDDKYIQKVANLKDLPNFSDLVNIGFLEEVRNDASAMLAPDSTALADAIIEKRREEKRRKEKNIKKEKLKFNQNDFEKFFLAYPVHRAKEDAQKAFARINPDSELLETMMTAIENQKKEFAIKKNAGFFVPEFGLPASWLNGKRWMDEVSLNIPVQQRGNTHAIDQRFNTESNSARKLREAHEFANRKAKELGICGTSKERSDSSDVDF